MKISSEKQKILIVSDVHQDINRLDKIIKAGTYQNAVGKWYPKKQWYIFAYEDPDKYPHGINNSVIVYDFRIQEWFPFCNWLVGSMETEEGFGDNGQLIYGDSNDSYVHLPALS